MAGIQFQFVSEVMIRSVSLYDDVEILFCNSQAERDRLVAVARGRGITQIRGVRVEDRWVYFRDGARPGATQGLRPPAVANCWSSGVGKDEMPESDALYAERVVMRRRLDELLPRRLALFRTD